MVVVVRAVMVRGGYGICASRNRRSGGVGHGCCSFVVIVSDSKHTCTLEPSRSLIGKGFGCGSLLLAFATSRPNRSLSNLLDPRLPQLHLWPAGPRYPICQRE